MEEGQSGLYIQVPEELKKQFKSRCIDNETTMKEEIIKFMQTYIGVEVNE